MGNMNISQQIVNLELQGITSTISDFPERGGECAVAARRAFLESTVALELVAYLIECPSL